MLFAIAGITGFGPNPAYQYIVFIRNLISKTNRTAVAFSHLKILSLAVNDTSGYRVGQFHPGLSCHRFHGQVYQRSRQYRFIPCPDIARQIRLHHKFLHGPSLCVQQSEIHGCCMGKTQETPFCQPLGYCKTNGYLSQRISMQIRIIKSGFISRCTQYIHRSF